MKLELTDDRYNIITELLVDADNIVSVLAKMIDQHPDDSKYLLKAMKVVMETHIVFDINRTKERSDRDE